MNVKTTIIGSILLVCGILMILFHILEMCPPYAKLIFGVLLIILAVALFWREKK